MRRVGAGIAAGIAMSALCTATAPAAAHDVWLGVPERASTGGAWPVRLFQGHAGEVEPVGRNPRRLARLEAFSERGEPAAIPGLDGRDPAGIFRPTGPGAWIVVYEGLPARHRLGPLAFERHLEHEGLEWVIEARRQLGRSGSPGLELYSRHLKALLPVDSAGPPRDRTLGLDAELVLEGISSSGGLVLAVLLHGEPVAGALVDLLPAEPDAAVADGDTPRTRTGADGRARFPRPLLPDTGQLVATTVVVEEGVAEEIAIATSAGSGAQPFRWRSYFLALTFPLEPLPRSQTETVFSEIRR
ncbi:MAG: DUF4198 domain-containing protein [Holophagales bacterium]|nr:DUF4198 domain-containing protein [Holophagales bacterium]